MAVHARTLSAPRVLAGVPAGGQFATQARRDPDVVLAVDGRTRLFDSAQALTPEQMLSQARASARMYARRGDAQMRANVGGGIDSYTDDLASDALADALATQKRAHERGEVKDITAPYIHTIVGARHAANSRGLLRAEDRKALGILNRKVDELEAGGVTVSAKMRDELAAQIRADWPDERHRPAKDFVEMSQVRVSLLSQKINDEETLGDRIAESTATADQGETYAEGTPMANVLTLVETDKRAAKMQVWAAIADVYDAPQAAPGAMGLTKATRVRAVLGQAGGINNVVAAWRTGTADTAAVSALFSPFGDIDDDEREAAARALTRRPELAEDMFRSAVYLATR